MRRLVKILGLAMVLTAILVVAIAGTALAAGPTDNGTQTQNQGAVCPAGSGVNGDCVPNNYSYNNNNNYLAPGPHGK
jgi:hypothetical protein